MAENSAIQWLKRDGVDGATWNPWISCQHATYIGYDGKEHVHPGCLHCYAENQMDKRYHKCQWGSAGNRVKTSDDYWKNPARWNKRAVKDGVRVPVFPSLCDPFEAWDGEMLTSRGMVAGCCATCGNHSDRDCGHGGRSNLRNLSMSDLRRDMFGIIDKTQSLDWILFTKRPWNVPSMWPGGAPPVEHDNGEMQLIDVDGGSFVDVYRRNVTLCYSVSNQETLDYGAPLLLKCANLCQTVGLSIEPMLGPVQLCSCGHEHCDAMMHLAPCPLRWNAGGKGVTWVIIGCESNGPRVGRLGVPSLTDPGGKTVTIETEAQWWEECANVVRQCREAGVPCFVKQGPRDGWVVHDPKDFPEECRVREFP